MHVHPADEIKAHILHAVERLTPRTLHVNTPGCGNGYTLHIYSVDCGKGHTLHIHTDVGRKGKALHVHTAGCGNRYTLHIHTACGGREGETHCTPILLAVEMVTHLCAHIMLVLVAMERIHSECSNCR
jgi:hypothetical protein